MVFKNNTDGVLLCRWSMKNRLINSAYVECNTCITLHFLALQPHATREMASQGYPERTCQGIELPELLAHLFRWTDNPWIPILEYLKFSNMQSILPHAQTTHFSDIPVVFSIVLEKLSHLLLVQAVLLKKTDTL